MDVFENENTFFPTSYEEVKQRLKTIDPIKYGKTRNFTNGAVTHLSPYISRGIISTKMIFFDVLNRGYNPKQIEKFIQELAWRDYWQQIWIAKGEAINQDLKNTQNPVSNTQISNAIATATTNIEAIDKAITEFYKTGYMHNHLRMYVAAIACNIGQSHWLTPAKWMYFHLLDADWASNALSWQWVAGANANKKYVANQENINKYCFTQQKDTFLDISYDAFQTLKTPDILKQTIVPYLTTDLPISTEITIDKSLPTCIYNFYNLDPLWKKNIQANRILLLEPSHFKKYPVSQKSIDFTIRFSDENIEDIQIYVGEFDALISEHTLATVYYKEHPLSMQYEGVEESRDGMFDVQGYHSSFFAFRKKCKKQLKY